MSGDDGFLQGLLGSIQSHIEERLKSPFAGAFVIAWVAVNWKALLLLAASEAPIEARIDSVATQYFSTSWSYLWHPLMLAAAGVLGYYALSAVFVVFYELYGILRRFIERKFDDYRWVSPATYIENKRATRERITELSGLAADQLGSIESLREQLAASQAAQIVLKDKLEEQSKRLEMAKGLMEILEARANGSEEEIAKLQKEHEQLLDKQGRLSELAARLSSAARIAGDQLEAYLNVKALALANAEARSRRPLELLAAARVSLDDLMEELGANDGARQSA